MRNESFEDKVCRKAIMRYGNDAQFMVLIEEMAELTQVISKYSRGSKDTHNLAEEIADVEIMLKQIKMMFDLYSLVREYKEFKILRLNERVGDKMPPYKSEEEKLENCPCNKCCLNPYQDQCKEECVSYQYWNATGIRSNAEV